MKKTIILVSLLTVSFFGGYSFHAIMTKNFDHEPRMRKVTGIGGIFFKCKNPEKVREWYDKNLGLNTNPYGSVFEWRQALDSTQKGFTQWSPFKETTKYFLPSEKDFMINYRVIDLVSLVEQLKADSVTILDSIEVYDYGKFVHIMDIEGNKIELWEPNDEVYNKMGIDMGATTTK
jgi:predicted enzyme related to lactoylglutathione lyase